MKARERLQGRARTARTSKDLTALQNCRPAMATPTAGVGLVLERALDGTLHITDVVPGGAAAQDGRIQRVPDRAHAEK